MEKRKGVLLGEIDKTIISVSQRLITVSEENQINQMIEKLRDIKGSRYNTETVDRLLFRIINRKTD